MVRVGRLLLLFGMVLFALCEERPKTTLQIILDNGYPAETHKVHTADGYILTAYRIPHGRNSTARTKGVFFVQHGLLGSSSNFLTNMPSHSLAFTLADAGYDVWLGNTRGNVYSMEHEYREINSDAFWDFSHDEMAKYDFTAMVDHALRESNREQLYYVGHSQGTLIAFAELSENEEFRKKIKIFYALAPVASLQYINYWIEVSARAGYSLKPFVDELHIKDPLPIIRELAHIYRSGGKLLCMLSGKFCEAVEHIVANFNTSDYVFSELPLYLTPTPEGTSLKNLFHYAQLFESKRFQKYDYGFFGNLLQYGSPRPPVYNLGNVHVPVVLFSGSRDVLSTTKDVALINNSLPNVLHNVIIPEYKHLSFTWSKTANDKVYKPIVKMATEVP